MPLTKAQMRDRVLQFVRLKPEGNPAEAEHAQIVENVIDAEQAFLESEGLAYWEVTALPDGIVNAFRGYIAARAAPELLAPERAAPYVALEDRELLKLRRFNAKKNVQIKSEFF